MADINKQRVTLLSRKEIAAHEATGANWGLDTIPREKTLEALRRHGITDEVADTVILQCVDPLGRYLMDDNYRKSRLSPAEVRKQARETAAIAVELRKRIMHMEPALGGLVSLYAYRMDQIDFPRSGLEFLTRMEVVMAACAKEAEAWPSTVPKRTAARNRLVGDVVGALMRHVEGLTKEMATEVAADLLAAWGVSLPADERERRRSVRGK